MTPQSDQVSRQREREAFETFCIKRWRGDRNALGRDAVGEYTFGHVQFAFDAFRAALALPSETPVGHQIERDGKESGAVGGDGWISVEERLPDEDVPVFALYPKGEIEFRVRGWDGDGWYWCNPYGSVHQTGDGRWESDAELDDDYAGVTHWMPLPAPPNAEREASTPSARSDIPQDPVFISELSAAGEKSGAVGEQ